MLNRLLNNLAPKDQDEELSPEEEKKARIEWHRRNVRNGPANFTTITEGRHASRVKRQQAATERKVNRRHRARWMKNRLNRAVLRGQLQAVGALPYATNFQPTEAQRVNAGQWIVGAFGERYEFDVPDPKAKGFFLHRKGDLVISDSLFPDAVKAAVEQYTGKDA